MGLVSIFGVAQKVMFDSMWVEKTHPFLSVDFFSLQC